MPAIKARELKRMIEDKGEKFVHAHLSEALQSKQLRPEDFSIQDLWCALVPDGREIMETWNPRKSGGFEYLQEAGDAIKTSDFSNITGPIIYSKIMEAAQNEEFVFTKIVPTVPTRLSGEKMPGISGLGDQAGIVAEADPYPLAGVTEDWVETPATTKRGFIVPITKEAIFFDRTNLILDRASKVGESLGMNKEKRIIDVIVDENTTAGRYKWKGVTIATYGDNSGTHTWDNLAASTALADWTDINAAEQLLANMVDPNTGEPIVSTGANMIIVTPELAATAFYILNATSMTAAVGGFNASATVFHSQSPTPIGRTQFSSPYTVATSRYLPTRMATDTSWYLGNPSRAFAYMENWPITVTQAPPNSEAEFTQDIVTRYKVSERGATATIEPRLMVKATVA